jgi:hypothetical protein
MSNIYRSDLAVNSEGYLIEQDGDLLEVHNEEQFRQQLIAKLKFFKGEYFLDRREGISYYDFILVKNPNLDFIDAVIRLNVKKVPGVTTIDDLTLVFDNKKRKLKINLIVNGTIEISDEEIS